MNFADPEIKEQAIHLRKQGMTYNQIAEKLGFSLSSVRRWINPHIRERHNAFQRNWAKVNRETHNARKRTYNRRYPERALFQAARDRAKKLNVEFNLSIEDIIIPEICPYLNIPLRSSDGRFGPNSPSLDRIFPEKGYVKDNVIVVSAKANIMKNNSTPDEFAEMGKRISDLIANDSRFRK